MISIPSDHPDSSTPNSDNAARTWKDEPDVVQGIVLLRKGEMSLPALDAVHHKVEELNKPGKLPPGMKVQKFDDRTNLVHLTTETVQENLIIGLLLVTGVLLIFLNHWPSALIVAINIPLALLFSFAMLYLRGKSANLLSLGAVDFGIIVDSSVIMVESIYRSLSAGENSELPIGQRVVKACSQVESSLFFSTVIMVVALLPLFTMQGPEGQIFGPMADTYAFALAGALLLSLTLSPMLCRVFFARLGPQKENTVVKSIKSFYLWQLRVVLHHRWLAIGFFSLLLLLTAIILPFMGMEFMPALEEGNVYVRGTFPVNISLEESTNKSRRAMEVLKSFDEAKAILCQVGRPDDGTDRPGFSIPNSSCLSSFAIIGRKPKKNVGWLRRLFAGEARPRTKEELVAKMSDALDRAIPGVDWNFSQMIRDNVMETLSGVKGENSIKIFGPDLEKLETIAEQVKRELVSVPGVAEAGIFSIKGQSNVEFYIDREKCAQWGVDIVNVQDLIQTAVGGKAFTQMVQGEKKFDVTLRFPHSRRDDIESILDLPVEVSTIASCLPTTFKTNSPFRPSAPTSPNQTISEQLRERSPVNRIACYQDAGSAISSRPFQRRENQTLAANSYARGHRQSLASRESDSSPSSSAFGAETLPAPSSKPRENASHLSPPLIEPIGAASSNRCSPLSVDFESSPRFPSS